MTDDLFPDGIPGEHGPEPAPGLPITEEERQFTEDMKSSRQTGKPAEAVLRTDDRVLARITDGIYRQPSSALRELIFECV